MIKIFTFALVSILSMLPVYSHAGCIETSFKENYLNNFNKKEILFIKGIALDVFEYGRKIKVIENLKGNFAGDSSIFVWGASHPSNELQTIKYIAP